MWKRLAGVPTGAAVAVTLFLGAGCNPSDSSGSPAAEQDSGPACPAADLLAGRELTNAGIDHGQADFMPVWTAADSPHILPAGTIIQVTGGHTLTIEPCAVVVAGDRARLEIGDGNTANTGNLVAEGTADAPIVFTGQQQTPGSWEGITIAEGAQETKLAYVTIEYAGDPDVTTGSVLASGRDLETDPVFDHVTIRNSGTNGFDLAGIAQFGTGSGDNTVTGSAGFPVAINVARVGSVPEGAYTGNGDDRILMRGEGALVEPAVNGQVRFPRLSVPLLYDVGWTQSWDLALTIDAGVHLDIRGQGDGTGGTLTFTKGGSITADGGSETGRIVVQGDGGKGWDGLWFGISTGGAPGSSTLNYVDIHNAGATGAQMGCTGDGVCCDPKSATTAIGLEGPSFLTMTNTRMYGDNANSYAITRNWCSDAGGDDSFTKASANNHFFGSWVQCPVSDQVECNVPNGCTDNMSCCLHDYTCFGSVE